MQTIKDLDDEDLEDDDNLDFLEDTDDKPKVQHGKLPDGHHLRKESKKENGHEVVRISSGDSRPKNENDPLDEALEDLDGEDDEIEPIKEEPVKKAPMKK